MMESDEIEMSRQELQNWVRGEAEKNTAVFSDLKESCNLLQSLLDKRQSQFTKLVNLCKSVKACEKTVKELYALLGWEYSDLDFEDSDRDAEPANCRRTMPFLPVRSGRHIHNPSFSRATTPPQSLKSNDETNRDRRAGQENPVVLKKEAVVVLFKLSQSEITAALRPSSLQINSSEDEALNNSESETEWEPEGYSSDSNLSASGFNTSTNKRKRIHHKKHEKTIQALQRRRNFAVKRGRAKPSTFPVSEISSSGNSKKETSTSKATLDTEAEKTTSQASTAKATIQSNVAEQGSSSASKTTSQSITANSTTRQCNAAEASTPAASVKGVTPASHQTSTAASEPQVEICVNMTVLARKKSLSWKPGKITDMITKENGKVKYKVVFNEKGKSFVSGHHLAFDCTPKLSMLFVGARVVVECEGDQLEFKPGILAELPSRKNRMRFMVFIDDHTPLYLGLPSIHLVCKPLSDPLEDIPNENHRCFMREYLSAWPYPPVTQFQVGQTLNAEYNGVQEKCEVLACDSSLFQVVFLNDQHKEWLYQGSARLEHMINMKKRKKLINSQ